MKRRLHRLISFIQTDAPSFPSSASQDLLIAFTTYIYSIWNARLKNIYICIHIVFYIIMVKSISILLYISAFQKWM